MFAAAIPDATTERELNTCSARPVTHFISMGGIKEAMSRSTANLDSGEKIDSVS